MANVTPRISTVETVYHYFHLWRLTGFWERINASLRTELRIAYGRKPEPSAAILERVLIFLYHPLDVFIRASLLIII